MFRTLFINAFSVPVENTLALLQSRIDFSLITVEAPKEYTDFGRALATYRRNEAVEGKLHQTARKLGRLFQQVVPDTPNLIRAYGLRASEIIATEGINPRGTSEHGPFEDFVGADGTGLWAAATSGMPHLALYLLACLLARVWTSSQAVAIWLELVEGRREEIRDGIQNYRNISEETAMSANIDISRNDLTQWDASARAWLQSADQAKSFQQAQLAVIAKSVRLSFSGGSSSYKDVVGSWRQALEGIERLVNGEPQEVITRAILVAFSAWHIYPDLLVFQSETKKVEFKDPLVQPGGIVTLGIQHGDDSYDHGSKWSLALSHLRYYGDPVVAVCDLDCSRISIQQLHIIALGSLLDHWAIDRRLTSPVCTWFVDVWQHIQRYLRCQDHVEVRKRLQWLQIFAAAAERMISPEASTRDEAWKLFGLGKRQAKFFLGASKYCLTPFFGLANSCILKGLSRIDEGECGLNFLRELASEMKLKSGQAFIRSERVINVAKPVRVIEYATVRPHTYLSKKRDSEGECLPATIHARWLYVDADNRTLLATASRQDLDHIVEDRDLDRINRDCDERLSAIRRQGELAILTLDPPEEMRRDYYTWSNAPPVFAPREDNIGSNLEAIPETDISCCPTLQNAATECSCFERKAKANVNLMQQPIYRMATFIGGYQMFIRNDFYCPFTSGGQISALVLPNESLPSAAQACIQIKPHILAQYLCHCTNPISGADTSAFLNHQFENHFLDNGQSTEALYEENIPVPNQSPSSQISYSVEALSQVVPNCPVRLSAMQALTFATDVYSELPGAMISSKIIGQPLNAAPWNVSQLPWLSRPPLEHGCCLKFHLPTEISRSETSCPRENALSCIAHFETGSSHLKPDMFRGTIAIATGNSIFAIATLLSDPSDAMAHQVIKRITGNIGRPGLSLLVAPDKPKIRRPSFDYKLVNHHPYDGQRENNFASTSIHLTFTEFQVPAGVLGTQKCLIDQEVFIVEAVVSVREAGKWVADLDVLSIDFQNLARHSRVPPCRCDKYSDKTTRRGPEDSGCTSIDCWEEFLDSPVEPSVFRARGNWSARLAAVSIMSQRSQHRQIQLLGPEDDCCLECLTADRLLRRLEEEDEGSIPPPIVCID